MAELTLGTALFVFLVLVPGFLASWASGKPSDSGILKEALYRGISVFALVTLLAAAVELVGKAVNRPYPAASDLFGLFGGGGDFAKRFVRWTLAFYVAALVTGFLDLWLNLRAVRALKMQTRLRNLLIKGAPFEVSPRDDMLFYAFLYYRCVGKRPYVAVKLNGENRSFKGEVLKFAWGQRGGLLVLDADDPRNVVWVPLERLSWVRFENTTVEAANPGVLPRWQEEWLEMIHPGLAVEVKEKLQKSR